MAIGLETNLENSLREQILLARCIAGKKPEMIIVHAVHERKIVFKRRRNSFIEISSFHSDFSGFKLNSGPNFYLDENHACSRETEAETKSSTVQSFEDVSRNDNTGNGYDEKVPLKSISIIRRQLPESILGWPLRPRTISLGEDASRRSKARSMSITEWVMNLPTRSCDTIMQKQSDSNSEETNITLDLKTEDYIVNDGQNSFQVINSYGNESVDRSSNREDEESGLMQEILSEESTQLRLGWPLLRVKTSATSDSLGESEASKMRIANCQSTEATPKSPIDLPFKEVQSSPEKQIRLAAPREQPMKEELVLKLKSSGCKQFRYEELKRATHKFSTENLIGEGGCSDVYKGRLGLGKLVAVKVLKQYKEAWNDFFLEVDIMSSLKHKHITHLIGVCIDDNHLILVYDFLSKGTLEERLQGQSEKSILPWKVRFKVAIAVAEALHYLHSSCLVIHRDVKSSNILLSSDFQPQLSDFGCATWNLKAAGYTISNDIVGTFGYIAPEYFMHGRVSDKTDIYSFGIVLLELLTGKKPISSNSSKGQESLVKWAMPLLESGNLEALVDPKLGEEFDIAQMERTVLAATLCIKQLPRLRPKASQAKLRFVSSGFG
ncbi:receptor-like cytoplasmic kinase 176 isoform X2 [Jatropha curcas]|uniref:receptor-like cytoplasmic kinase 176 isoform X2 n=1 Tax=Jatropha curcas TaxID=180498 RepID=UPI0009D6485D|nr:receptor-like cytoplasmic kinase 176 isoform X2 [Jatropha curcas]